MDEQHPDDPAHRPAEISYDEQFFPARPRALRPRGRLRQQALLPHCGDGEADSANPEYVRWLREQSMLHDAKLISAQFSGTGSMWQNPFAKPDPAAAIDTASVWFSAYPLSLLTRPGQSFLAALGDPALWAAFRELGIQAVHTGPVKQAGGLRGWELTPSVDGHFDRISTHIDPVFGDEQEFRAMCETAEAHGGTIIDDIVPGHTGKGADFRLAEMNVGEYPGIYHMVAVPEHDWHLLPEIPDGADSVNLDEEAESRLEKAGYIVGRLQRVIFHDPGFKDTNWSATAAVRGPDGLARRWVYLHYFKQGQPSINWLDPTFAGMRLVVGDALHSLADLGSGALRLDANGFLGVEKSTEDLPAWSEGHPLSAAANQIIASMVRKLGGFTFQELNLTIDDIRITSESGADLSYDFVNRPAYHHALATADTEFLRLTLRLSLEAGVQPISLVHSLQNHDELTYELVHFATGHHDDVFPFRGDRVTGDALAERIRSELQERLTGSAAPYNLIFTTNGIASTTLSVITASLGYRDLHDLGPEDVEPIRRAHLLLCAFNALQPGVFALSGWDVCGMLPIPADDVRHLIADGDTRWIHRPAYDLMGACPEADRSTAGLPRAVSLYGSLPEQLIDAASFARRLSRLLVLRDQHRISTARQLDVALVGHPSMLAMVHELPDTEAVQITVLNFADASITGTVQSEALEPGSRVVDAVSGTQIAVVDDLHAITVDLAPHQYAFLVLEPAA